MGALWPLQVDVFIAVSELALFVGLIDRWAPRSRLAAWAVTVTGLAVSVAGNIGRVTGHSPAVRATAAVPPLAAASALAVGLGVLKRVVDQHHQAAADAAPGTVPPPVPGDAETVATASLRATLAAGNPWSGSQLADRFGRTRTQAAKVRQRVLAETNGHPRAPQQLSACRAFRLRVCNGCVTSPGRGPVTRMPWSEQRLACVVAVP